MGVDLEKYVGVVVDVDLGVFTGEYLSDFMDNFYHGFADSLYTPLKKELDSLNFKRDSDLYDWRYGVKEGDILILADGMNDEYVYLMYVLTLDGVEYASSPCKADDKVNELLAKLEIPSEIIEKLGKVHKLLFDEPLKDPRYLYLNHYS